MKQHYRHGDISFHPISNVEGEEINHTGSFVLAEGETTGHKHVITVERPSDMRIFKDKEGRFVLELLSEGQISHEEHKTIKIAPGVYRQNNEREFDWFSLKTQRVID